MRIFFWRRYYSVAMDGNKKEVVAAMRKSGIHEETGDYELALHIMLATGEGDLCLHEVVDRYWKSRAEIIAIVRRWRGWFACHTNARGDGWRIGVFD